MPLACSALVGDVGDDVGHLLDRFDDLGERSSRPVDEFDAILDLTIAVGDQVLDVLGGLRGARNVMKRLSGA
jgi:hypothetical protein